MRTRLQGQRLHALFLGRRRLRVVIAPQQPSDEKPSTPEVLDVHVEVLLHLVGVTVADFELQRPELHPLRFLVAVAESVESHQPCSPTPL